MLLHATYQEMKRRSGQVHGKFSMQSPVFGHAIALTLFSIYRAGVSIYPHPDVGGHDLQTENFKYFWALAHRDPTSGVQVRSQRNTLTGPPNIHVLIQCFDF